MAYRKTSGRLTALGKKKLEGLLKNPIVMPFHKSLIRAKLSNSKNISKADADIIKEIMKLYR